MFRSSDPLGPNIRAELRAWEHAGLIPEGSNAPLAMMDECLVEILKAIREHLTK